MAEEESEVSLCSAYCVVYTLVKQDWAVTGKGWTQVHVYQDKTDGSHRIVGWTVSGFDVVINANVSPLCKYKKKSDDFHRFTDEENNTFGFGFFKTKENAYDDSQRFLNTVVGIISQGQAKVEKTKKPLVKDLGTPDPVREDLSQHAHLNLGKLTIRTPKALVAAAAAARGRRKNSRITTITAPLSVTHDAHVRYNEDTRVFEGVPKEWEGELKRQFGVDPSFLECVRQDRYVSPIPAVLVQMKDYLLQCDAFKIEGLFRIAADADECVFVKKQLNDNTFTGCQDIHCISNLLKVWFRDLPKAILFGVTAEAIESVMNEHDAAAIIQTLPEPSCSIFLWLVDLCVEVAVESATNKMSGKNLAIVCGPNLFHVASLPASADPMATMRFSQTVANFFHKSIIYRERFLLDDPPAPVTEQGPGPVVHIQTAPGPPAQVAKT